MQYAPPCLKQVSHDTTYSALLLFSNTETIKNQSSSLLLANHNHYHSLMENCYRIPILFHERKNGPLLHGDRPLLETRMVEKGTSKYI